MNSSAPKIGFDRFIQLDWAAAALNIRAGVAGLDDLNALLDASKLGAKAKKNTKTVLNKIWLEPQIELRDLADRGIELSRTCPEASSAVLSWGMAVASYPFFGRVAELIGRLSGLQGDSSTGAIQRRMSETYGERETTRRSTSRVIQTMSNWGWVDRVENGKRVNRFTPSVITNDVLTAWLIEASVIYAGRPVAVTSLHSLPVLFPFTLALPLTYLVSSSPNLNLRSEGPSNQFVDLKFRS